MKLAPLFSLLLLSLFATVSQATVYELPADGSSVVGTDSHIKTVYKDTLLDIARRNSLGYYEIIRANPGVDMWLPGDGTDVMLPGRRILPPGPREGVVVNLPEHRLYYYPKPRKGEKPVVITYPVSIGKMDWKTPLGETHVIQKEKHPFWYPPESVRKEHLANGDPLPPGPVKPGPDNPLGDYAMRLAAGNGTYLIHGTNNPMAVGMAITHGCIRMYPEDVAALFPLIPVGTKVWLINEPVKVAFVDGELLMEAHPPVDDEGQNTAEPNMEVLSQKLDQALGNTTAAIHWDFAKQALQAANGIPTVVGIQADMSPQQAEAAVAAESTSPTSPTTNPESTSSTPSTAPPGSPPASQPDAPTQPNAPAAPIAASPATATSDAATTATAPHPADPTPRPTNLLKATGSPGTADQHPADHQPSAQHPATLPAPTASTDSAPPETTLSQLSAQDSSHPSPVPSAPAQALPAPDQQTAVAEAATSDPHHQ
jgi:L,D-transpeptidase ErfK/SrfK